VKVEDRNASMILLTSLPVREDNGTQ